MMMRWSARILGFVALCGLAGCTRQCFLAEKDFNNLNLPARLEEGDQTILHGPLSEKVHAPPDVNDPSRPPRYLSLQEALALALERGTVSGRAGPGQGLVDDGLVQFQGGSLNNQSDSIRVLSFNPAMAAATLEASAARFDAQWVTGVNWSATDNLQQGLTSFQNGARAAFQSSIIKGLAFGGVANMSFQTDYTLLQNPPAGVFGVLNPNYTARVQFGVEMPLLQNYGVEINQLLNRLPAISGVTMPQGAAAAFNNKQGVISQVPSFTGNGVEGILIARLRFDAQRAEFERNVNILVMNTEVAYWKLYQAYGRLYSFEEVMRLAHKSWVINLAKFEAGTIGPKDFHPIRAQYEEFRGERTAAMGAVLEAERNLRGILGLPVEDGTRLVPITPPTLAPYRPNWDASLSDALNLKPELVLARQNLRATQYNLITAKNFLKPDLRFFAQYSPVGFGTELDGDGNFVDGNGVTRPANAFESLSNMHFNDWSIGLSLSVPIGYRLEHASVRSARLGLAQSYYLLKDEEQRVQRILTQQYQKLSEWYELIKARREERKYYGQSVEARYAEFTAGRVTVDQLLEVQRRLALAQVKEYEAISEYNNSLARFEWAKGTILQHNNVTIAEGPLPQCAQVRAVEHERERSKAFVLRNRPEPLELPGCLACEGEVPNELSSHVPNHVAEPILKDAEQKAAAQRAKEAAAPAKKLPLGFSETPAPAPQPAEVKFAPAPPPPADTKVGGTLRVPSTDKGARSVPATLPAGATQTGSSGSSSPPPLLLPTTPKGRATENGLPPPLPPLPIVPTGNSLTPPVPLPPLPPTGTTSTRSGSTLAIPPQTTQPGSRITIHEGPPPELPPLPPSP
ncbi:MAG: TolC family protein [Gemmataceae bacterium]|nr:TolC family protein [Gemmataceae bacterium]MCI0741879.1 TolC family protein [Gemmataceae bacterium]